MLRRSSIDEGCRIAYGIRTNQFDRIKLLIVFLMESFSFKVEKDNDKVKVDDLRLDECVFVCRAGRL